MNKHLRKVIDFSPEVVRAEAKLVSKMIILSFVDVDSNCFSANSNVDCHSAMPLSHKKMILTELRGCEKFVRAVRVDFSTVRLEFKLFDHQKVVDK